MTVSQLVLDKMHLETPATREKALKVWSSLPDGERDRLREFLAWVENKREEETKALRKTKVLAISRG